MLDYFLAAHCNFLKSFCDFCEIDRLPAEAHKVNKNFYLHPEYRFDDLNQAIQIVNAEEQHAVTTMLLKSQ